MNITYTLPVPDANAESFIDAFAAQHGWTPENPASPVEYSRMVINNFIRESVSDRLATLAAQQAQQATLNAISTEFNSITSTLTVAN